ncbi:MAG: sigma-70 domain-containing protein [Desulfobacteraceae bacterium]|jgi:hypothetical protein
MSDRSQDIILWRQWNKTKNDADLQALLKALQPLINQQITRWGSSLSRQTLEIKAKILAVEAIKSYNPNVGATLATHVTNRLQKLSRLVYTHTQATRLPEHKALSMATFNIAQKQLQDNLGREPTNMELADHLGWTKTRTEEFQRAYNRKELLSSGEFNPASFPIVDVYDPTIDYVYFDMDPHKQQLFEHITGYGGKPILNNTQLMSRFNLTQGQLSYQKRQIKDIFLNATKR